MDIRFYCYSKIFGLETFYFCQSPLFCLVAHCKVVVFLSVIPCGLYLQLSLQKLQNIILLRYTNINNLTFFKENLIIT